MPDTIITVTFTQLQSYANTLEDEYVSNLAEQEKMQKELETLGAKFEAFRVETAFTAASWRGLSSFAKKHFGKELESKASQPAVESDDKSEKKTEL